MLTGPRIEMPMTLRSAAIRLRAVVFEANELLCWGPWAGPPRRIGRDPCGTEDVLPASVRSRACQRAIVWDAFPG